MLSACVTVCRTAVAVGAINEVTQSIHQTAGGRHPGGNDLANWANHLSWKDSSSIGWAVSVQGPEKTEYWYSQLTPIGRYWPNAPIGSAMRNSKPYLPCLANCTHCTAWLETVPLLCALLPDKTTETGLGHLDARTIWRRTFWRQENLAPDNLAPNYSSLVISAIQTMHKINSAVACNPMQN